jgi:peptidoglycan-N-acetylglucosamine deacetylase
VTWQRTASLSTLALLGAHAAPAISGIAPLRARLWPQLAGLGSPGHVALTFDDGPDPSSTPRFLEALDRLGWTATFFMLGRMARRAPSLAAEVAGAGHEIALHGEDHRNLLLRMPAAAVSDLRSGYDAVAEASGREPAWFRPPYGVLSAGAVIGARRIRIRTVLWTSWGRDWRAEATPQTVVADVARGVVAGGTVLLHDSDCTSAAGAWQSALGALPMLAEAFARDGLVVGPLGAHGL